jgi:hypothetical protein
MLPKDFPPFTTVQGYFYNWRDDGLFEKINFALLLEAREAALRAALLKDWIDLIAKRKQTHRLPEAKLDDFTSKNVIRLGLETDCPHCQAKNWTGLETVDYQITCARCLKAYPFPQAHLKDHNRNWSYRVVGPFSIPDYGRGSYAALLALRVLNGFASSLDEMTFATAMTLSFEGRHVEVDFLALKRTERFELAAPPGII